jgi:hypothetical protein
MYELGEAESLRNACLSFDRGENLLRNAMTNSVIHSAGEAAPRQETRGIQGRSLSLTTPSRRYCLL